MRGDALILVVAACGGAPPAPTVPPTPTAPIATHAVKARELADPLAVLASPPEERAWIVPGLAQLELGGPSVRAPSGAGELGAWWLDEQGDMIRVAVKVDDLAYALWTERARLLGVIKHDQVVSSHAGGEFVAFGTDPIGVELHPGAHVRRLARRDGWSQIRYLGSLEIDGWVPDGALVDRWDRDPGPNYRIPTGRPTLLVTPGAVIHAEPQWASRELALIANGYHLDEIKQIDADWSEVGYEDGEVRVHGYMSRVTPPGRVHVPHLSETQPAATQPNATVPEGTCLYASERGEPIGFVVAAHAAELAPGHARGWVTLGFDTPWGPLVFAGQGTNEHDLVACAPAKPQPPPAPIQP